MKQLTGKCIITKKYSAGLLEVNYKEIRISSFKEFVEVYVLVAGIFRFREKHDSSILTVCFSIFLFSFFLVLNFCVFVFVF